MLPHRALANSSGPAGHPIVNGATQAVQGRVPGCGNDAGVFGLCGSLKRGPPRLLSTFGELTWKEKK
jgi:hypothetical protein